MLYKIGEFADKVNTSIRTLRYYDEIDLLKPAQIDLFTNYRYYSENQIDDFNVIKALKDVGFSLDEIRDNFNHFNNELMLQKKEELKKSVLQIEKNIKTIDILRSKISNGRIILHDNKKTTEKNIKVKSLF